MRNHYLDIYRREDSPPIIIYRLDRNGKPILNPNEIMILRFSNHTPDNIGDWITLKFDSQNKFEIKRYELLHNNEELSELKKVVDKKLSKLEGVLQ